ncbi:MAG: cupin domain-containing protein [Steroidobacteraceae bacterium]
MRMRTATLAALASLTLPGFAAADSTPLDLDKLRYETVHGAAQRAVLVVDSEGQPLVILLRIAKGQFLPPHGAAGPVRVMTVVSGTLSLGNGHAVDEAAEHAYGPGSVIVLPAGQGEHWAAARHDDVLLQVVMLRAGKLSPAAGAQLAAR